MARACSIENRVVPKATIKSRKPRHEHLMSAYPPMRPMRRHPRSSAQNSLSKRDSHRDDRTLLRCVGPDVAERRGACVRLNGRNVYRSCFLSCRSMFQMEQKLDPRSVLRNGSDVRLYSHSSGKADIPASPVSAKRRHSRLPHLCRLRDSTANATPRAG